MNTERVPVWVGGLVMVISTAAVIKLFGRADIFLGWCIGCALAHISNLQRGITK